MKRKVKQWCQQFHQYHQNEESSLSSNHRTCIHTHIRTKTYGVGNLVPGLGQAEQCGRVKLVNRIPTLPVFIIQKIQMHTNKNKPAQIPTKKNNNTINLYAHIFNNQDHLNYTSFLSFPHGKLTTILFMINNNMSHPQHPTVLLFNFKIFLVKNHMIE